MEVSILWVFAGIGFGVWLGWRVANTVFKQIMADMGKELTDFAERELRKKYPNN